MYIMESEINRPYSDSLKKNCKCFMYIDWNKLCIFKSKSNNNNSFTPHFPFYALLQDTSSSVSLPENSSTTSYEVQVNQTLPIGIGNPQQMDHPKDHSILLFWPCTSRVWMDRSFLFFCESNLDSTIATCVVLMRFPLISEGWFLPRQWQPPRDASLVEFYEIYLASWIDWKP